MLDQHTLPRLIFVTGKGGVGKSMATAGLARALARTGKRVIAVETDAYSALSDLLDIEMKDGQEVRVSERLYAVNLSAEVCLITTISRFLPSRRIAKAITQNRVAKAFFRAAPSVNEFVLLDQIRHYLEAKLGEKPRFDHVLVDLPASGHAVTFLNVPATLGGMMRGVGPVGKLATELADRIRDEEKTAVVAICLPEEMPVQETIELAASLKAEVRRSLSLVVVNMVHRSPFDAEQRVDFEALQQAVVGDREPSDVMIEEEDGTFRLVAGNALSLQWCDRDSHYLELLRETVDAPIVEVPMIFEIDDLSIVEEFSVVLAGDVESGN